MATRSRERYRTHAGLMAVATIVLSVLTLLFVACGIGFGEEPTTTELLKKITIEEPVIFGEPVTVTLDYAQQYPVAVKVQCDLLSLDPLPDETPSGTATAPPLILGMTPEPTLPRIPRARPTPKNKVLEIMGRVLDPNEDGGPVGTATPVLGTIQHRFFAPEPGEYVVWCYTPLDQNSAIFQEMTVLPR